MLLRGIHRCCCSCRRRRFLSSYRPVQASTSPSHAHGSPQFWRPPSPPPPLPPPLRAAETPTSSRSAQRCRWGRHAAAAASSSKGRTLQSSRPNSPGVQKSGSPVRGRAPPRTRLPLQPPPATHGNAGRVCSVPCFRRHLRGSRPRYWRRGGGADAAAAAVVVVVRSAGLRGEGPQGCKRQLALPRLSGVPACTR